MELVDVGVEIERAQLDERAGECDGRGFLRELRAASEHVGREAVGHVLALAER